MKRMMRKLKKYKPTAFKAKDSYYDQDAADFAVAFIENLCHTKGTWAGKPFELIDWQEQIIRDLFGILKPNGYRQFNTAYVEIPKKMGKSELAAAVALLLCCGDGEERAEVYGCAADRQQASIVFEVAADMVRMCPALSKRVKILASQKRIIYTPTNSFYQVLSAEAYSKHGFNIHGVVFDELHTQPNRKLFDVMTKGSGDARMQPLYFLITTAGTDTHSICYETHQKAKDILEGRKIDPTFYPVIYGADESEDWTDPKVWKKANPSLGITVGIDKVKAACDSARQNPGEENSFRQLRLNQWVKQAVRWMPMEKWDACAFPVSEDDLEGRVCYGGLDLSSTTDITAFVLVFPPLDEDDKYVLLPYFWVPEDTLDLRVRRDHVPYEVWERQGFLMTTEGNVVHYGYIEKFIEQLGERFNIREIAFDRWGAIQMVQNLEGMGFTVVPFGQGFKDMSPPTKELMKLVLEKKIAHGGHPVLRWMMDNIYIRTDPAGNIKADKEKSTEKIDGAIATIMGLDRAIRCGNDTKESVYDTRGLLFVLTERTVIHMGIFSGLFRSRDKPTDRTAGSSYAFYLGGSTSGKVVTERSAIPRPWSSASAPWRNGYHRKEATTMVNINGTTITITRGDTLEALLEILCADGQPYEVRPGDVIRFALKQKYADREPLLLKEIPHDTLLLRLEAEETKLLTAGWAPYVYDIQLTMEDGTVDTFIDRAEFIVTEEVD